MELASQALGLSRAEICTTQTNQHHWLTADLRLLPLLKQVQEAVKSPEGPAESRIQREMLLAQYLTR